MTDEINYTAPPKPRNTNGGDGTLNLPQLKFGRSIGLKLMLVCALVLLMGIPAAMIAGVSFERAGRASDVQREVSARYGGPQTVMGPMIVAPFTAKNERNEIVRSGYYIVYPERGLAKAEGIITDQKQRSLYRVTTYRTDVKLQAQFNLPSPNDRTSQGGIIDWTQARIFIGIGQVSGLSGDVVLRIGDKEAKPEPGFAFTQTSQSGDAPIFAENYTRGASVKAIMRSSIMSYPLLDLSSERRFDLDVSLPLGGAERLSFGAFAKTTEISLGGDWPHPGFAGQFAPKTSEVTEQGFSAQWYIPYQARGIAGKGTADALAARAPTGDAATLNLVEMVGPYQTVNRALKYSIMFIGLIFMSYFLFEIMLGVRVHPAQYILIGLVQAIFYLLLLSLAEHIGFVAAYALSALATIGVTSSYAAAVFGGRKYALSAAVVFSAVYGLQFVLLQVGDFALLIGAMTSFGAVTATLYLTRGLNWYGDNAVLKTASKTA